MTGPASNGAGTAAAAEGDSLAGADAEAAADGAALAVALGEGQSFDEAVRLGIRAAALCIQQPGAQPSIPRRDAVLQSPLPPDWTAL